MLAGCGDSRLDKDALHLGLSDKFTDPVFPGTGGDIEIRPQPRIRPEPVFIHGVQPVDSPILMNEESDGPVDLIIIL